MKLLFVEDEEMTQQGVITHINWDKLGIDHVIPFSNPLDALAYVKKEHIDIILSDIRMPHMDGISLCKKILNIDADIRIIFISGHSDKEYLMNAIQLSAVDYVEKPISIPKLELAIEKAAKQKLKLLSDKNTQERALNIIQQDRQDKLVSALIHGHTDLLKNNDFQIPLSQHKMHLNQMPINSVDFYRVYLWKSRSGGPNFQCAIHCIGKLLLDKKLIPQLLISQKNEHYCLFIARFPSFFSCNSQKIDQLLRDALHHENMNFSVSCSYGSLLQGAKNIHESYTQAVIAMQSAFFSGYGSVLPYQDSCYDNLNNDFESSKYLSALVSGIRNHDREYCQSCLEEFYSTCRMQTASLPDAIRNEYYKIISSINEEALKLTFEIKPPDSSPKYLWKHINSLETLKECHTYALEELLQLFNDVDAMISNKKIIMEVIHFIQTHYSEQGLFIGQIAKHVHISPNYLSTLFKKETGKTIGNFITEVRLEQSCRLLNQADRTLNNIAQSIGYTDTNYYAKQFRKYYNMSPSEYRKRIIKEEKYYEAST